MTDARHDTPNRDRSGRRMVAVSHEVLLLVDGFKERLNSARLERGERPFTQRQVVDLMLRYALKQQL